MKWNKINNFTDIENFMDFFGGFHDSCLKELYMWTEAFVDEDLSMSMSSELDTCVRVLFQRQVLGPSAIELLFKGVTHFHIHPRAEDQDSIIYGAKLLLKEGQFYWAESEEWQIDQPFLYPISWISAKELHWREVSLWMGKEQRYGVMNNEENL
ncbi:hypothetical protein [Alkalicoccus daliensis]|uniref:Uncharacterized protein n=1 Tax=Alkalicoccus daliensis TaxID=745820 RepID=A0A1H0CXJ1_9BACI|nr:hypothetical protein [Alkalicoccus daliensis]SDN62516.1 hypothetical protein SAMN04488053_102265 [Alkalicoccus daliensis]